MQQQESSMNRLIHPVMLSGVLLLFCHTLAATNPIHPNPPEKIPVKKLLLSKAEVIDFQYNSLVQNYIESYTVRARPRAGRIISRSKLYFPIIEKYLKEAGLPDVLKYMTVIESAVNPNALSPAGAVGLWQLMPNTARRYGLRVSDTVDDRRDVHKSTQAAIKYLVHLRKKLGDWTLAVAAYNCGGGKVLQAKRYSYAESFWELRMFLPKETQYYIHKLAAAVYVMNYYHLHDLQPSVADYYLRFTKTTKVYNEVQFLQISRALDIPIDVLIRLNPSYKKEMLPYNKNGNYLILPKVKMGSFVSYHNFMIASTPEQHIRG